MDFLLAGVVFMARACNAESVTRQRDLELGIEAFIVT